MTDWVVQAKNLVKTYKMGEIEVQALRGVSFNIKRGEVVSIMGPSGSGKSTMMNTLGCLDRPTSGEYILDGESVAEMNDDQLASVRNRKIGFVFQSFNLLSRLTAVGNVELPLRYAGISEGRRAKAQSALEAVGLKERMLHRPYELSGGQQQRVAIARSLVNDPAIIMADEPTGNLDSKVGKEIMSLLLNLNKERGTTLIIVTHDPNIAEQTQRVIRLRDGELDPEYDENGEENKMTFAQALLEALESLNGNKMRSGLTVLGIVIGVAAVIAMLAVGNGAQASITGSISSIGTNLLFVFRGSPEGQGGPGGSGRSGNNIKPLTLSDANAIADPFAAPSVEKVAATLESNALLTFAGENTTASISGVSPEYFEVRNIQLAEGEFINAEHLLGRMSVVVLGPEAAITLFGHADGVVGETIRIEGQPFRVIGVLVARGGGAFGSEDNSSYIPFTTAQSRLIRRGARDQVDVIYVQAISAEAVPQAQEEISNILRQRHRTPVGFDDFTVFTQADFLNIFESITGVLTIFLGGIAGISLLVGGIGIMNIMLVSVTERTREIGLRKALGARKKDILLQFLTESSLLSLLGGIIGIMFGWLIAYIVGQVAIASGTNFVPIVGSDAIILSTSFSAIIGLFFGIYPASRAANLEPVEALRYE